MADERKAFLLRLPPSSGRSSSAGPRDELRSVNGQIEYVLRQAVTKQRGPTQGEDKDPGNEGER